MRIGQNGGGRCGISAHGDLKLRLRRHPSTGSGQARSMGGQNPSKTLIKKETVMKEYDIITLETSIKPFLDLSSEGIKNTVEEYCSNWVNLIERSKGVAILLWVSDGNEIYEWRGDLEEDLICANSIGFCNYENGNMVMYNPELEHYRVNKAVPYSSNPPKVTFAHLKEIIHTFKTRIPERFNKPVRVGATIDPGPEFAPCRFKIEKHSELLLPDNSDIPLKMRFMTHQAILNADDEVYAGFPDGIPEKTSFGTFLGRQFESCRRDLGFDYIWFSNGFAYTHYPWDYKGEVFNGSDFNSEEALNQKELLGNFWSDFRRECPDAAIEVRGSNFSVGMDISSDGCSHDLIAEKASLEAPPCNPPWGSRALGLEMSSFLSRIAKPYTEHLLFRFYLNDPWFASTPWEDYYAREPFDIYSPTTASRLLADASVKTSDRLALLSVDTEKGELVRSQAIEVMPHLIRVLDEMPDAPGPFIWVYPHDEYHKILNDKEDCLDYPFMHDWFITQAINNGLPLNTVVSSDVFNKLAETHKLHDAIYIAPVPVEGWEYETTLIDFVENGGKALLYGPVEKASQHILDLMGIELDETGLDGDFDVKTHFREDNFCKPVESGQFHDPNSAAIGLNENVDAKSHSSERIFRHYSIGSGGALFAKAKQDCSIRAELLQNNKKRVYALHKKNPQWNNGELCWVRGSVHFDTANPKAQEPAVDPISSFLLCSDWMRRLLAEFAWDIIQKRETENNQPAMLFIKRYDNAFYFTGHKPDTTVQMSIKTPYGAPIYNESQTHIKDGYALDNFGRSFYNEVRAFVKMNDGIVSCKELPVPTGMQRHISISGLKDADLIIFPAIASRLVLRETIYAKSEIPYLMKSDNHSYTLKNYSGVLYISW